MKLFKIIAGLFLFSLASPVATAPLICKEKKFALFDSTAYKNKSRLFKENLDELKVIYVHSFWKNLNDKESLPAKSKVKSVAKKIKSGNKNVVIDIEHWPLFKRGRLIEENQNKYISIIKWMREARPDLKYGLYATVPIRDYWRYYNEKKYGWYAENSQLQKIVGQLDAIYPSLYTVSSNPIKWKKMAIANLQEAKRISAGKPVYAFLWPQYHQGNKIKRGQYLDGSYWRQQLETVYKYADGVVIWGGWKKGPLEWDEKAEWWEQTKQFISQKNQLCID